MGTSSIHFSINIFLLYIEVQYLATCWMVWGMNPGRNKRFFFLQNVCQLWGPPSLLNRCKFFFPKIKQQEHELTTHLHHSAQVKEWHYTSACPVCLHSVELDSFTFIIQRVFFYFRACGVFLLLFYFKACVKYNDTIRRS